MEYLDSFRPLSNIPAKMTAYWNGNPDHAQLGGVKRVFMRPRVMHVI